MLCFSLTLVFTPLCRRLAVLTNCMDMPKSEQHKLHGNATPLLGGVAMFSAWILTILLSIAATRFLDGTGATQSVKDGIPGISGVSVEFTVLCLCAFAALVLGLVDDKRPMKAGVKFLGQFLIAATAATWGGVQITLFIGGAFFSWCATVLWLLFIFNAVNFFDNMDGLVVGTAAIAFTFFTLAAVANQQYFVACLGSCSAAAAYGFWFYNHAPASIFMGDAGSHFLGFLLGVVSAKVTYFNPELSSSRFSILIPLFVLAVPIFDALAVIVIRLANHKPIYVGDHNHISHRFLHMGMTRKRAVLLVHLLALTSGLGALPLLWGDEETCMVLLLQGIVILTFLSILQYSGRLPGQTDEKNSPGSPPSPSLVLPAAAQQDSPKETQEIPETPGTAFSSDDGSPETEREKKR